MHARTQPDTATLPPGRALVERILATHHAEARRLLEGISAAAADLRADLMADPGLPAILEDCELLEKEMLAHLAREEQVLFPLIIDLEANGADEGDIGMLFSPIVCMKREHGFIDELLERLDQATGGYVAAAGASPRQRDLLRDLAAFAADTREHVRVENEELFPLATELVPEVR